MMRRSVGTGPPSCMLGTIEIFEALGLADQILDQAVRIGRDPDWCSDLKTLGTLDLDRWTAATASTWVSLEDVTESVLTSYLEDHGGRVTRSARLTGIASRLEGLAVTIERDGEQQ